MNNGALLSVPAVIQARLPKMELAVCTENLIRVDDVMESPKLAE